MPGATVPNVLNFKNVPGFIAFQQIFLLFQKGLIAQILIVHINMHLWRRLGIVQVNLASALALHKR